MKKKTTYCIRNWSEYNASLKKLGSLTIWVSSEAVENWTTDELTGEPGASPTYTDPAIRRDHGEEAWARSSAEGGRIRTTPRRRKNF
jgi:hypothetical protein